MDVLPARLPAPDAAQIPNVIAVKVDIKTHIKTVAPGVESYYEQKPDLSGVRISQFEYITAGHGIRHYNGTAITALRTCGALAVDSMSKLPTALGADDKDHNVNLYGNFDDSLKATGQFINDGNASKVPDIALIQTQDNVNDTTLPYDHPTRLHVSSVSAGTPLFFENYEPTKSGRIRDPYEANLGYTEVKAGLNWPAMFGGVVVRRLANGTYDVIVGTKSYGRPADALGRGGMSGGPVYEAAGDLVGISDRASGSMSVAAMEATEGVDLSGVPADTELISAIVQPVTPQLISMLRKRLRATPACTPTQ